MTKQGFVTLLVLMTVVAGCMRNQTPLSQRPGYVLKTEAEWKKQLTPEQYHVLREKGTERAYGGSLLNLHDSGTYTCAACHQPLFSSTTKFESGTGWPSFWKPISDTLIAVGMDNGDISLQEVICSRCGGHLGHVFDDGPKPTGQRYCLNSVALTFEASEAH